MPRSLTQYRISIGSPAGLGEERKLFRDKLEKFTKVHAEPLNVTFYPVGWEDTISGVGRPQEQINEDLRQCDYAVFVLHDRWGSPTDGGYSSGTEEEWQLAEQLYKETKIRNIALFFKRVDPAQLRDPGKQLNKVITFKEQIEQGKKYLFRPFESPDQFGERMEEQLAKWLRQHEGTGTAPSSGMTISSSTSIPPLAEPKAGPNFDYWIGEAKNLTSSESPNYSGALFCSEKALAAASTDIEWARAMTLAGVAQFNLKHSEEAVATFVAIFERMRCSDNPEGVRWIARALVNQGITLGQLDRSEEAIAAYDYVVARFGSASELPLRELVAKALDAKEMLTPSKKQRK